MAIRVPGLHSPLRNYWEPWGKVSLAYRGLGEIFVFLFFGLFSVIGSYYLFTLSVNYGALAIASAMGLMATTFICINNLRDRENDRNVGKMTLATKMNRRNYQALTVGTIFIPYVIIQNYFIDLKYIFLLSFALIPAIKLTLITYNKKGAELNEGLKFSGIHLIIFSLMLSLIFLYEN